MKHCFSARAIGTVARKWEGAVRIQQSPLLVFRCSKRCSATAVRTGRHASAATAGSMRPLIDIVADAGGGVELISPPSLKSRAILRFGRDMGMLSTQT